MNTEHIDIIANFLDNCLDWTYNAGEEVETKVWEALVENNIKLEYSVVHLMLTKFFALDTKLRMSPSFDTTAWVRDYLIKEKLLKE